MNAYWRVIGRKPTIAVLAIWQPYWIGLVCPYSPGPMPVLSHTHAPNLKKVCCWFQSYLTAGGCPWACPDKNNMSSRLCQGLTQQQYQWNEKSDSPIFNTMKDTKQNLGNWCYMNSNWHYNLSKFLKILIITNWVKFLIGMIRRSKGQLWLSHIKRKMTEYTSLFKMVMCSKVAPKKSGFDEKLCFLNLFIF